jgi:hypothetical protein
MVVASLGSWHQSKRRAARQAKEGYDLGFRTRRVQLRRVNSAKTKPKSYTSKDVSIKAACQQFSQAEACPFDDL